MFPHHSPDNYRGRECHLSRASSTEDDSRRSVVCQTCRECGAALTHSSHARTHSGSLHTLANIPILPKVNHMCPLITLTTHGTLDSFGFVPADCSTFFLGIYRGGSLCQNKRLVKEKRVSSPKLQHNFSITTSSILPCTSHSFGFIYPDYFRILSLTILPPPQYYGGECNLIVQLNYFHTALHDLRPEPLFSANTGNSVPFM